MDFRFTKEQEELKASFVEFFKEAMKEAPPVYLNSCIEAAYETNEGFAFHRRMQKELGKKGWLAMAWPKEYGGQDAPIIDQLIFNQVREASGCPGYDYQGIGMFAPTLIVSADEDQKARLLPPIAKGEVQYCQGWSEPDAGSDLAALSTTAIRDGDEYVVNGQKTWTSMAHRAESIFLLARTDPNSTRSKGLSAFHVDMKTPGIEVRPLYSMSGVHVYNDIYFKDVRIPARDLIGGEGNGWAVTMNTMNFERSGMGLFAMAEREFYKIIDYIKKTKRNGKYLSEDPVIRQTVAKIYAEIEGGKMMGYRIACIQEKSGLIMAASVASESKVFGSELIKRVCSLATEVMGLYGMLELSEWAPLDNIVEFYQFAPGLTIAMGSNEIQRCIIAWLGLRLPRIKLKE
ncbi:MAG: acyl-CoA dehydrogenase family protein [Deltaproteobacteria bacterium]|nr:acyl-CoA dehydrogenase family protein [Deltaproteobacteria bacterium]